MMRKQTELGVYEYISPQTHIWGSVSIAKDPLASKRNLKCSPKAGSPKTPAPFWLWGDLIWIGLAQTQNIRRCHTRTVFFRGTTAKGTEQKWCHTAPYRTMTSGCLDHSASVILWLQAINGIYTARLRIATLSSPQSKAHDDREQGTRLNDWRYHSGILCLMDDLQRLLENIISDILFNWIILYGIIEYNREAWI